MPKGDEVPRRVLVVDDDELMRAILTSMLTSAGFEVEVFASAAELLSGADLDSPAVLLLDVQMPVMSGLDLQSLLRSRGVGLPVIFLTGGSDIPKAVQAMRNGALNFLEKPPDREELITSVRAALQPRETVAKAQGVDYLEQLSVLTPREREVYDRLVLGMTSKWIALELGGSFRTIEIHRARVMQKLRVTHLAQLVRLAVDGESRMPGPH